jgi:hypothetical protein
MTPYEPAFEVGEMVQIAERGELEDFMRKWKHHNPLTAQQLDYAGKCREIVRVGIYHGGDVLYELSQTPGIWHEACLKATDDG